MSEYSGHAGSGTAAITAGPLRDVVDLTAGPATGPVRPSTLVADEAPVVLTSGAVVDAWTFGGSGIRVTEGDVVDVRLINRLDTASTTVHWYGIDVPNAMDGVAGVTQDAVPPGGEFSYRFPVVRPGTYWFRAHQNAGVQVSRGLFGAIVVEPRGGARADVDETVLIHDWPTRTGDALAFGTADRMQQRTVRPGSTVRLRVVNTESSSQEVRVTGAPFGLAALDGTDLHEPGELTTERIAIGGGGRADRTLRMPEGPVRLATGGDGPGLVLSPDGATTIDSAPPGELLDITRYGRPAPTPFGPTDHVDREHRIRIGEGVGFSGGGPDYLYTINDQVWPDVAPLVVREGELVRVTVVNAGLSEHPMHLHGHHVLVLRRDGRPASGSPLWLDTLLVRPGETWEVAFRTDNPGVWMDHCHIPFHATSGMMMHLQYEGVRTSFDAGAASGNVPE